MMRRRALFAKLGAVAAAVAVAPTVKAEATEAAPVRCVLYPPADPESWLDTDGEPFEIRPMQIVAIPGEIVPLTFETMQADCAVRGCELTRHQMWASPTWRYAHSGWAGPGDQIDAFDPEHLSKIDKWRRDLHIGACRVCAPPAEARPFSVPVEALCPDCQGQIIGNAFQYVREDDFFKSDPRYSWTYKVQG